MVEDTIAKIQARLRSSESLAPEQRAELEDLLQQLRREVGTLPETARDIRIHKDTDAQGAMRTLQESLAGFEGTHPELVGLVNRISTVLANMGI
jgi:hypothetical protein